MLALPKGWTLGHAGVLEIIEEIENSTPRATIIVGAALIDDCLLKALRAVSPITDATFVNKCFGNLRGQQGSIRDFSQRIDLGAYVGMYGLITHGDLDRIRDMRNAAAHGTKEPTFTSATIKGLCRDLKLPEWQAERRALEVSKDAKARFITNVAFLTDTFMMWNYCLTTHKTRPSWSLP